MNEYIIAYGIPVIIFMNQFSRNTQTRCRIPEYYKVTVYAYEDYAPGQLVFAWYKNLNLQQSEFYFSNYQINSLQDFFDYYK